MRDRGSVLMLMPAAVLVVLVLGAVAVDTSVAYLAQRDLQSAATAAANDAVTYGIDLDAYHGGEGYVLDPGRVNEVVATSLAAHGLHVDNLATAVTLDGLTVTVSLSGDVDYVFAKAVPGAAHAVHVVATASATAVGPET